MKTAVQTRPTKQTADLTVLLVESEPDLLESASTALGQSIRCRLLVAKSAAEAKRFIVTRPIDLMVSDVVLVDGEGVALIKTLSQHQPTASAMVLSGEPSVDNAVSSLRNGAVDFVAMPVEMAELVGRVSRAWPGNRCCPQRGSD